MPKKNRFSVPYRGTGFKGYPIGAVCYYGPDECTVTKIVASVVRGDNEDPAAMRAWVGSGIDRNQRVHAEIEAFLACSGVRSVLRTEAPIGCIHEEGKDFPVGGDCPFCPAWKGKQVE